MNEINIAPQNVSGTCNYKCLYRVNYKAQSATITNYGNFLGISHNSGNNECSFNGNELNTNSIKLEQPSSLNYNNEIVDAQLTMLSSSDKGVNNLNVSIPISTNGVGSKASTILSDIIQGVSKKAPSKGESTNSGMKEFSLNEFIPKDKFYSFTDKKTNTDYISFGLSNAIYISDEDLEMLQSIISKTGPATLSSKPDMYINNDGPVFGTGVSSDEIYIDCQPTNSSEQEVAVSYNKSINNDLVKMVKSEGFQITLLVIVSLILLYLLYKRFASIHSS